MQVTGFEINLAYWFDERSPEVDRNLRRYFDGRSGDQFTGRWFEHFADIGDPDRFEASDIVAVEALSVKVRPEAAATLLIKQGRQFSTLLRAIPVEKDLWEIPRCQIAQGSPAWDLHAALTSLPKVGRVTAGKLMAAKRPRLIPVFDKRIAKMLKPAKGRFWLSMYDELRDAERREVIEQVCRSAPPHVSLLRRIDVALWMAAA